MALDLVTDSSVPSDRWPTVDGVIRQGIDAFIQKYGHYAMMSKFIDMDNVGKDRLKHILMLPEFGVRELQLPVPILSIASEPDQSGLAPDDAEGRRASALAAFRLFYYRPDVGDQQLVFIRQFVRDEIARRSDELQEEYDPAAVLFDELKQDYGVDLQAYAMSTAGALRGLKRVVMTHGIVMTRFLQIAYSLLQLMSFMNRA